jgi:hypothetical protein
MGPSLSRRRSILLTFEKLTNEDTRDSTTPPSPIMPGGAGLGPDNAIPRLPPIKQICPAIVCSKLLTFKLAPVAFREDGAIRPSLRDVFNGVVRALVSAKSARMRRHTHRNDVSADYFS